MPFKFKIQNSKFKILCELLRPAVFIVVTFAFYLLTFNLVHAQVPNPPVPCSSISSPEFQSLRPYQASATCLTTADQYATFCGNTLTLQESVKVTYRPGVDNCTPIAGGKVLCNYSIPVAPHKITINLSGANLPIMGNTEEVTNYKGTADQLTDVQKVNEYVSWYLNGVNNRAEYSLTMDSNKIINFSGPLNKLLPQTVSQNERVQTVKQAGISRHDQIVGCVNLLGEITPCYPSRLGVYNVRLSDWNKHLPPNQEDFSNSQDYQIAYKRWRGESCLKLPLNMAICIDNPLKPNYWGNMFPYIPLSSTEDLEGNIKVDSVSGAGLTNVAFTNQVPSTLFFSHIQESSELGSALQDTYISKDQAKTGPDTAVSPPSSCTTLDVRSNKGDNLFASALWGDLSYTANFSCTFNGTLAPTPTPAPTPRQVLSAIAQAVTCSSFGACYPNSYACERTYGQMNCASGYKCGVHCSAPLHCSSFGACYPNSYACETSYGQMDCGTGNKCGVHCSTPLHCSSFGACYPNSYTCERTYSQMDCGTGNKCGVHCSAPAPTPEPPQTCSHTFSINLYTSSNTPKIDDVWSRLVAGPTAIVKRLFPKLGTQIGTLKDIPGSTSVTITGAQSTSADLNFPHIGGISEYFLKGIQTLLRPKGYGEPISFGSISNPKQPLSGDICAIASKYNIPCCQLKGIISVETGATEDTPKTPFIGSGSCNGQPSCCNGNYCGPANISCSQYAGLTNSDNLDMCSYNDSAILLARAMLLALCQADANTGKIPADTCNSYDWSKWGDYILQHYTIPDGDYTASAYFYGLVNGCRVTSCSQYRWGAGVGYCDSVKSYCDTGQALVSFAHNEYCNQCNIEEMIPAGMPLTCP